MPDQHDIVIVDAARTAIGTLNGGLSSLSAVQLGTEVVKTLLARNKLDATDVQEVILGQVLTTLAGQNPARQTLLNAGIAKEATGYTINQVCGSGLRAVAEGMKSIRNGDATIVIAGGQESMSQAPHAIPMRNGVKFGDAALKDTMIVDGLWDVSNNYHMGITAENIAKEDGVTREAQDAFAAESQAKALKAQSAGTFADEIIPVTIKGKKGDTIVDKDENIRPETTLESLAKLRPAFKSDGTVTAGNASGINDGAAAVVLMTRAEADRRGLKPLVMIKSWATTGVDPAVMGKGPIPASKKALEKAGWTVADLDLIEANEAFAAQAICVTQGLGLDPAKTNVNGGAVALGHPIGASGARVLTTLIYEMKRRSAKKGLVTLCIGGGMGIAMCVEAA